MDYLNEACFSKRRLNSSPFMPGTKLDITFLRINHSVENTGVAFVKGANDRNESFENIKQTLIYDEQVRTNKAKD